MATPLESIIGAAESAVGTQYQWGGNSLASGVDCSGLVQQAFAAAGIPLPRVSASQARVGRQIGSIEEAQPGDLLSWDNSSRNDGADHIAIYIGNGMMIEAYRTGEPVRIVKVPNAASPRGLMKINRVIGEVPQTTGVMKPVTLGANEDRTFTAGAILGTDYNSKVSDPRAVSATAGVPDATVTAPPEGGLGDGLPPDASEEDTLAYIREHLPQYAPLLENDEIRYVLTWGVREDKSVEEIQGALTRTDYWQSHSAPSRDVDLWLGAESPAEVRRVTDLAKGIVSDAFARNGIELDDGTLSKLTMQAMRSGDINVYGQVVNPAGINNLVAYGLGQAVTAGETLPAGETSFTGDTIAALAHNEYMLPITRSEADRWAVDILSGKATEESIRGELDRRSRERYGLAEGQSIQSLTDGIVAIVADTLELDPDSIDLLDPKWNSLLEHTDEKGNRRSMTLGEATQWARDQPEFEKTERYQHGSASMQRGLIDFIEGRAA